MKKFIKISCRIAIRCFAFLVFFNCTSYKVHSQTTKHEEIIMNPKNTQAQTQEYKDRIVLYGDSCFSQIIFRDDEGYVKYMNGERNIYELEIPYLLIMANRYNKPWACFQIYTSTMELYNGYGLDLDSNTVDFLLFYLKRGAEMNDIPCLTTLYTWYNDGIYVPLDKNKAHEYWLQLKYEVEKIKGPVSKSLLELLENE